MGHLKFARLVLILFYFSVPPLFVVEFLHRVVDTFEDYFNECSESVIKDNCVVVYELLDEMLDNGFPLATESNILKELIKPPNLLTNVLNTVTGKSKYDYSIICSTLRNILSMICGSSMIPSARATVPTVALIMFK